MAAAIEQVNGRSLFATFREIAWHRLGTVFQQEVTDYQEMLVLAGLAGWNVRHETLASESGVIFTKSRGVVRTDPETGDTLEIGVVGNRYEIVQNEDKFSWLQTLSDGARWETAGALADGTVFGSLAFQREIVLDPNGVADKVETYALVSGAHDGSSGIVAGLTPVRVVCRNTLDMAMGNISNKMKFRHTQTVHERMKVASEFFRTQHVYFDAFEEEMQALMAKPVTDKQYANLVEKKLFVKPENDVKGSLAKWENRVGMYFEAWNGSPNAGIKGTGWGALNALTEANQWGRNIQAGRENGEENFYAAGAGFDIPTTQFRTKALALVKAIR